MPKTKDLAGKQRDALLKTLSARFDAHAKRHAEIECATAQARSSRMR
jgi:hypothetical protein